MKKSILILVGLLVNLSFGLAQSQNKVFGHVTDSLTQEPVEFVNVVLLNADSAFVCGAVTDSLGYFEFSSKNLVKDKNYIIQVTHVYYDRKMISFYHRNQTEMLIKLASNTISLDDVVVTGIKTKVRNRLNFTYSFTDQMKDKVRLTSRLLENIPTVFVDCNSTIRIKGSSNILILKNGIELTDNSLIDQIQPASVKSVEIMYNIPSQYANQNYTAIMNIITEREQGYSLMVDNKTAVDVSMNDTKVNIGYGTEKGSFYLFYKQYYRNLKMKTEDRIFDKDGTLLSEDLYTTFPRKECDNEFFYGYTYQPNSNFQIGVDGYLSLYRERFQNMYENRNTSFSVLKEAFNTQNYKGYADYKDDKNHLKFEVSFNKKTIDDNDAYLADETMIKQNENQEIYGSRLDYDRKINESTIFYSGVKYSHNKTKGFFNSNYSDIAGRYHCNNMFAYAELMKSLGENWKVDAGVNFQIYHRSFADSTRVKKTDIFAKFNISYAWDNSNLALGYSSYLNDPGIWKMLPFIKKESPNISTKGNPYLKPRKNGTLSLEYSYSKGNFYLASSAYYKQVNNQVVSNLLTDSKNATIEFININKVQDYGMDFTLSCNLTKWWSVSFYAGVLGRRIPANGFYNTSMCSYMVQMQSNWHLSSRLTAIVQYTYNSKELQYNGYSKSHDSNIGMINYTLNDYLDLYVVFIRPFGNLKSYTRIHQGTQYVDMKDKIYAQKVMLCLTFNLSKGKEQKERKIYENESKKY